MFTAFYPMIFTVSLFSLIAWFYFDGKKYLGGLFGKVFFGALIAYFVSVMSAADVVLQQKFFIMFRDLVVMASISAIMSLFKKNKMAFIAGTAVVFGLTQMFYVDILNKSFDKKLIPSNNAISISGNLPLSPDGELLVELKEATHFDQLKSIADKHHLKYKRAFTPKYKDLTDLDDFFVVDIPNNSKDKINNIIADLMDSGLVEYIEENETIDLDPMEITPLKNSKVKYQVNDPGVKQLWGFDAMNVSELYSYLKISNIKPKRKARVFILDTGVDGKHEDLKGNYKSHKSKYDRDGNGHGTHCAGIAGAVSNNKIGRASFSLKNEFVQISSIQVLRAFGGGTQKGIIDGMLEAADAGADVISMSLGGRSNPASRAAYTKAVKYCNKAGAIVVVAAGNSNMNAKDYAPANTPGVITVSAIDTLMNRASFSNYVDDVDFPIAAPGVAIYSSVPGNKYASFNGTSMACPYVAGLVGMMKSIKPSLTTKEAHKILKATGKKTKDTKKTGKLIQPGKAIMSMR